MKVLVSEDNNSSLSMIVTHIVKFPTPVKCTHCEYSFNNSRGLSQHMESEHQLEYEVKHQIEIKSDDNKDPEDTTEVKLNYVLNELKNVKVAKLNAKKRIKVDELNVRYELNSALFLTMKEEMTELKPHRKFHDESTQVWMEVDGVVKQVDKGKNNPATVVKWKIDDKKNKW